MIFAFNRTYAEEFDPVFILAETKEKACEKLREAYPFGMFEIYTLSEIKDPGHHKPGVRGIHTLKNIGTLRN